MFKRVIPPLCAMTLILMLCVSATSALAQSSDKTQSNTTAGLVLDHADALLYRKIFTAKFRGQAQQAHDLATPLKDRSLLNWTRAQTNADKMALWLPQTVGQTPRVYKTPTKRTAQQAQAAHNIKLSIAVLLKTDELVRAEETIRRALNKGTIDRIEAAQLWGKTATLYLQAGNTQNAARLAGLASQIGGLVTPGAAWAAGLAQWTLGNDMLAARYFAVAPRSPYAGPWLRAAGAYWTARALMRAGQYSYVSAWLNEAARNPRSFYGLIATRALGARFDFNWAVPPFSERHKEILAKNPGAVRAFKLAQAGQMDMARIELSLLPEDTAPDWREALAALATAALKPDAAIQIAGLLNHPMAGAFDTALYPIAPWKPEDGYRLDPALMHAFIRQESKFKTAAVNKSSGATGLLQIMPRTAQSVSKTAKGDALKNPETSLMVGQKYLEELLKRTDGNLFEAAIAYNAGPGNLSAWKKRLASVDDSLLFIELIPYPETRAYVERVMANYWIYSLRMGLGVASLEAVAEGKPARYATYDRPQTPTDAQIVLGMAR